MPIEEGGHFYHENIIQKSTSLTSTSDSIKMSDDVTSIGRQRSSEGHHVTFCDSLVESSREENDSSVIRNDSLANRNNSSAVKETIDTVRQCDGQPVSPVGDVTPKAPILRIHRTPSTHSHENPFTEDGELSKKAEYILRHSKISRTELKISDPDSEKTDVVDGDIVPTQADQTATSPQRPNDIHVKENGSTEEPLTPQSVEVEVAKASASQAEPQQAETVKLKSNKKCKCCVVQ